MPVTLVNQGSTVLLDLPGTKASAEVRLFGATVTSWKSSEGVERLFLSSKAALDGSAPIRGGIPIVFPVFGSPKDHADAPAIVQKLGKHGFARDQNWHVSTSQPNVDEKERAAVTLELKTANIPEIKSTWPFNLLLKYTVTLTSDQLHCKLTIQHLNNTSSDSRADDEGMPFQALLHNYFSVPDSTKATISGLEGLFYIDKVANGEEGQVTTPEFALKGEPVDRVHVGKPKSSAADQGSTDVKLAYNSNLLQDPLGKLGKGIHVSRSATLRDTVIWNCAEEGNKTIGDLEEGGWKKYVCVEPGAVRGFQTLQTGQEWTAEQTLSVW